MSPEGLEFLQGSDTLRLGVFRGSLWPEGRGHMGHRLVALGKPLQEPRQVERKAELGSDPVCTRAPTTRKKWTRPWEKGCPRGVCSRGRNPSSEQGCDWYSSKQQSQPDTAMFHVEATHLLYCWTFKLFRPIITIAALCTVFIYVLICLILETTQ